MFFGLLLEDFGIAGYIFDLLERNHKNFLGGGHLEQFQVITKAMLLGRIENQFLIIHENNFELILHSHPLSIFKITA